MGLFKSRRQRELDREIKLRRGKARIQRFIKEAGKVQRKYWELGKRALRLGDRQQFQQLAAAYVHARELGLRWERYLLQLEALAVRRDESAAMTEFMSAIAATTKSLLQSGGPDDVARIQSRLEEALARSRDMDEALATAMEVSAESIYGAEEVDEGRLAEIANSMSGGAEGEDEAACDDRIKAGLDEIEREMRKEMQ